jgi:iron only hydrogenase large subunit-like protein
MDNKDTYSYTHSVTLNRELCCGCINCLKRCPTEAIRVRSGKAVILSERCIDCGECIRKCPYHAKIAVCNVLSDYDRYKHLVALPSPALYAQFNNLSDQGPILSGLSEIGFDSVYEVAKAAEYISRATKEKIKEIPAPIISSACPAVLRLIRVRFPHLLGHVLPFVSPMELAARLAKEEISKNTGLKKEDIGCIFITSCPAKITDIKEPIGSKASAVDGAVAVKEIYPLLVKAMDHPKKAAMSQSEPTAGSVGISWGYNGGESAALGAGVNYLSCDGIENVIGVLNDLEDEKLHNMDYIELSACPGGCVGGVLSVENPYIARAKLNNLVKSTAEKPARLSENILKAMEWDKGIEYMPVFEMQGTMEEKFKAYSDMDALLKRLPGLDCGSCGAPTCRCFANDVINGAAKESGCVVIMRRKFAKIKSELEEQD